MAYDGKIMRRALQQFEEDRRTREERFQARRESIFRRQPRLREIEDELRSTMSRIITSALRHGTDPGPAVEVLREENLRIQEEKRQLLTQMGLPQDCLDEKPACALCGDTGYRNGQVCRCLRQYYAREQQKELSRMLDLGSQSFDTFSLDWYSQEYDADYGRSARENMETVYDVCADYAHQFGKRPGNLLLFGATPFRYSTPMATSTTSSEMIKPCSIGFAPDLQSVLKSVFSPMAASAATIRMTPRASATPITVVWLCW